MSLEKEFALLSVKVDFQGEAINRIAQEVEDLRNLVNLVVDNVSKLSSAGVGISNRLIELERK